MAVMTWRQMKFAALLLLSSRVRQARFRLLTSNASSDSTSFRITATCSNVYKVHQTEAVVKGSVRFSAVKDDSPEKTCIVNGSGWFTSIVAPRLLFPLNHTQKLKR
jgi:hypothetical protein